MDRQAGAVMPIDPLAPTDPFSRDDILSMTHQPVAPNPVPGIVKPAMDYLTSGDMMPAHKPGTQPKDYLRELLQHPDIMAKNIEQASNFAGMAGTLKGGMGAPLKAPEAAPRYLITSPEGKSYVLKHSLSEQLQELGGDWHSRPVIDSQGNVIHNPINSQHVSGPILRLNEDGTLTKGILAYHGSPHDFDKFDLSKIGTGEGAQAYGHGLYFAENERVAKDYRDKFSKPDNVKPDAQALSDHQPAWDKLVAERRARQGPDGRPTTASMMIDAKMDALHDRMIAETRKRNPTAHMYQVGINADPEHFLDWDTKLRDMPPAAQERLAATGLVDPNGPDSGLLGSQIYRRAEDAAHAKGTTTSYTDESRQGADALRQAGIPGIKYLDQGSRMTGGVNKLGDNWFVKGSMTPYKTEAEAIAAAEAAGGRTSNYVVFDDKLIDILKKYGWAGLGLPAMGAAVRGDQQ